MATSFKIVNTDKGQNWNFNTTQCLVSAKDCIVSFVPGYLTKLMNQFVQITISIKDLRSDSNILPENIRREVIAQNMETITTAVPTRSFGLFTETGVEKEIQATGSSSKFTMEGARTVGNIFNYVTSKWALGCIVTAVILNRTNVYARTRWNLQLSWKVRFLLRITPIILLAMQCRKILQSLHCQTSPEFTLMRWGNASVQSDLIFNQSGNFLYKISSILLLGASDKKSCLDMNMIPPEYNSKINKLDSEIETIPIELKGSLPILWPLFKTFAFSQFVETISCAVLGRQIVTEYGMSLFELSLAFTEAEAIAMNKSDIGGLETSTTSATWINTAGNVNTRNLMDRPKIIKYINTSPEVLLIGFISAMNHLTSHFLALFDQQSNFRLLNTGIWGLAYTASILQGISSFSLDDRPDQSIFRFPTVCVISFIPHVLIIFGIVGCSIIYIVALLLTATSLPPMVEEIGHSDLNSNCPLIQKIWLAHKNMQANVSFSRIHVTLSMDFYTALLRTGISIMSMANEAVYLNESRGVNIKQRTWLEDERLQELETNGLNWLEPRDQLRDSSAELTDVFSNDISLVTAEDQPIDRLQQVPSGYLREMITHTSGSGNRQQGRLSSNVAGTTERSGRWYMAFELCLGFSRLLLGCYGAFHLWLIARLGIRAQPKWLLWMARPPKSFSKDLKSNNQVDFDSFDSLNSYEENSELKKQIDMDIEDEFRKIAIQNRQVWTDADEKKLDADLYRWWLDGGCWGEKDSSGNFAPTGQGEDDDTSSVVSTRTTEGDYWQSDSADEDNHLTPTQMTPLFSRESTPYYDTTLTVSNLAQLLNPKTPEMRAEAEALSIHLSNDHVVTRSRFHKLRQRSRAKFLTSTRVRPPNFTPSSPSGKLTLEEESQILEYLIVSRRGLTNNSNQNQSASWARNNIGIDEAGPLCVVCQTSPRCIIIWPCRCLSLCNDCRVTLAMNNFEKCVCCRRDVGSFSRIFVP
ncbi:putative ubiquitin-protein ligase [Erysiphe necator]|uniref:Putative ubiquitin-protein ligase n=1 Tax=Uncinula necator TaxID=52586 RepID=A0A0B1PF97_UNCNE|nr:putative ubiquitin-protein ligase [Erysiphe necator]